MITHCLPLPNLMWSAVKKITLLQNEWQIQGESESPTSQEEILNSAQQIFSVQYLFLHAV